MKLRILAISLLSMIGAAAFGQAPSPIDTLFHEKFDPPSGPDSVQTYNNVSGNTAVWNDTTQFFVSSTSSYHAKTVPFDILYFQTDTFSTMGKVFIRLQFDQICKVYFLNKGIVEVSVDSGSTWTALDSNHYRGSSLTFNTLGYFNEIGYNAPSLTPYWGGATTSLPGATPTQNWWANETFDISSIAGTIHPNGDTGYQHVMVRWGLHHVSTQNVIHGWNIDNILIEGAPCELEKPILNWNLLPPKFPVGARYQNNIPAKVEVFDNTGIDSVVMYYSKNGAPWQDTLMTPGSSLSCTGSNTTIQFTHNFTGLVLGDTIDWYIEAYDCACPNYTRDPIATAIPNYYTFWIDPSPPAICGPATPSSFPYVAQVPYIENFDGPKWIYGTGTGATGTSHRGSFPVGNPPTGENWTVAPTEVTPGYGWSIRNTATSTNQTGPNKDNTTGFGKFIYTEADQGSTNDLTQFITPCIDIGNASCAGLEFYYHMFGNHINLLRVDVDTGDATPKWVNNIWKQTGPAQSNSTDAYQRAFVDLKQFAGKIIRIRFIGKRGNGVRGDMAIDDIRIYEPNLYDAEMVTYYTPENGYCSYSSNDSVTVKVRSTGCQTISKIPIGYDVVNLGTGATTTTWDTVYGNIETGFDTIHKFNVGANLSGYGTYNIFVFTNLTGDGNSSNDTIGPFFVRHEQPYSNFPYIERYDNSPWSPGNGTTGNPGTMDTTLLVPSPLPNSGYYAFMVGSDLTPTSGSGPRRDRSYNGNYIYGEGNYGSGNTNALLVSRCMDLTGMSDPIMDFWYHAYGTDAGAINFQIIEPGENDWSFLAGSNVSQPQQIEEKDDWRYKKIDLSSYAGEIIKIRMIISKAGAGTQADIAIDDFGIFDQGATDVGVAVISPPNARINQLAPVKPSFKIRNFGKNSVSNVPITYTITPICGPNAGVPVTYTTTYSGTIAVNSEVTHTPATTPTYPDGDFEICAYTTKTGDNITHNDQVCKRSVGWPEKFIQTGFFEDFDNCTNGGSEIGFFPSGDLGIFEVGAPSNSPISTPGSSPNSYMTGLDFDYFSGKSEQLNMPRLTGFDTIARAELRFGHRFDLGSGDAIVFEYLQGTNWITLGFPGSNFCPTWYNQGNIPIMNNGPGWQGSNTQWENTCWPLSIWDFSSASLIGRFNLVSGAGTGSGWAIDDIEVYIPPQNSASPVDINSEEYIIIPYQDNHVYTIIENTGGKKLTECLVQYSVDGGAYSTPELVTFNPPLWPGFKRKYVFNQIWQSPAPGPHDVCVLTSRPNAKQDNLITDDTLCLVLNTLDLIDMTVDSSYCNDFEDPTQVSWITLNTFYNNQGLTKWEFGTPNQAPITSAFSGSNAWMTDLSDNYKLRDSSALITPVFKVDSGVVYNISFMHNFKTELYHDGGCVEATYDGINWYNVGDGFLNSRWHNVRHVTALDILKSGWSGNSHGFTWQNSNLNVAFDGNRNVVFRFRFGSDHSFEYAGWAVDDFCFKQGTGAKDVFIGVDDFDKPIVGIGNLIPNPSSGLTYVPIITASTGDIRVTAYNMVGQVMMSENYHYETGEGRIDFDVNGWTPGVYIVAFELEGTTYTRKLVVQ